MADIRDRAEEILSVVPPIGQQINSDGPTAALFTKLTGVTHETLVKNWSGGGIMTCCNAFVGWYASQLGSKQYLGRFDLEQYLPKIGMGHTWVKSTADVRPKYGDICRHTAFHVGVSLDFDGEIWNHVDAGQGGPKAGHDILKRTRSAQPYDYKKLQGWIDIELFFGSAGTATGPIPEWLLGWWEVTWRAEAYYYYFDRSHQVKWTQSRPRDTSKPPMLANDTGSVTVEVPSSVMIRWGATGSVEKFTRPLTNGDPMEGTWNDQESLTAETM